MAGLEKMLVKPVTEDEQRYYLQLKIQKMNKELNAGTEADSSTTAQVTTSASLAQNPLLAAVIGQRVRHIEQKYIGTIKADFPSGYCVVDLENKNLRTLYPFGIRAELAKLVAL